MSSNLHSRASALFLELRELPPEQRGRAIMVATNGDDSLRREVESLLAHDDLGTALTSPVPATGLPPMSANDLPATIGPYRVLERIGRGGSGFVLLAQQDQPVQRRVAIKIVPHAAISPEFAARFDVERRALERTDHPNIAGILDAGRTPDGLPYLVIEYVQGVPISTYCRQGNVRLRDRIELMLDVADAVQHAHQRGVIHRDLKPANILVADVDGKPVPRVLDFGIAKPISEGFGAQSPPTAGYPLGTPAYMAPEQTGGRAIDTRADVYALGAILYELTAGRPPIDTSGDPVEALRRIREQEPAPASRVRAQHGPMFAGDSAPRSMLADLDCILGRALEKSPDRRYPAVSALADDLRRLLKREPIVARAPTLGYRIARFTQRNRVLVASVAAVIVALSLGVVGLTLGLVEAKRQQREALDQFESQREINTFLTDDLLAAASPEQTGKDVTALDLLHRASRKVDARFAGRPLVAATIHHALGVAFTELSAFEDARKHLEQAIALRRANKGPNTPETLHSEIAMASLLARRQLLDEADVMFVQVIQRARLVLDPNDPALYTALNDLGVVRATQGKAQEAIALFQEALTGRHRLLGQHDVLTFATMSNLADAYDVAGDSDKALKMQVEALDIAEAMDDPPAMALLALNNNVGATYQDRNQDKEAEPYVRRAAELAVQWLGNEHPDTLTVRANLAGLESELGNHDASLVVLDDVIAVRTRLMGFAAYDTLTARYARGNTLWRAKRFDESAADFKALLPDTVQTLTENHWFTAQVRSSLARSLADGGHNEEALPLAEEAARQFAELLGPDHARTTNTKGLVERIRKDLGQAP